MRDDDAAVVVGIAVGADVDLAAHADSSHAHIEALCAHRRAVSDMRVILGLDRGAALDIDIALGHQMDAVRIATLAVGVDGDGIVLRGNVEGG